MDSAIMCWPNEAVFENDAFVTMKFAVVMQSREEQQLRAMHWWVDSHDSSGNSWWYKKTVRQSMRMYLEVQENQLF
jgi:hypothetical protein